MLLFAKDLIADADIDSGRIRVGLLTYSTAAQASFHLNQFVTKEDVFDAIDEVPYLYGSKNTADALRVMRTEMFTIANGDRLNVDNVVILVTDGVSNINAQLTVQEAESARADDIHIITVGIGLEDTRELQGIASKPISENIVEVKNFEELNLLVDAMFMTTCAGRLRFDRDAGCNLPPYPISVIFYVLLTRCKLIIYHFESNCVC